MDERPLHVLHLTAGSDAGGVSRYVHDLSVALTARGHRVTIAGQRGAWHGLFEDSALPWIDAPLKAGLPGLWRASRILRRYVRENPVDVIHAHYRKAALVGRSVQKSLPPTRPPAAPLLFTLHMPGIPLHGPWRWLSDFGDHVHAPSAMAAHWLMTAAGVPSQRLTVIPHGVDPEKYPVVDVAAKVAAKASLGFTAFDRVAAFVGRFDDPKNPAWMLDVAAGTRQRIPRLKVLLVGQGPQEPALRAAVAAEGLADRVFFLSYRAPLQIYHAADALLMPSGAEGFGLAAVEAMAAGVPVLRTLTGGAAEQIVQGVTGRTTDVDRTKFLIAAADFLADDPALTRMGAHAARHVRQSLTFERQLRETLALYQRLVTQ